MSFNLDICVWPDPSGSAEPGIAWRQVLESVPIPKHSEYDGSIVNRFEHLRVFSGTSSTIVSDEALHSNEATSVLEGTHRYVGPDAHYEVNSAFDYVTYSETTRRLEPTLGPLRILYYGPQYEWEGQYYKRFGPIRLSFSNTKAFRIPPALVTNIRDTGIRGSAIDDLQSIATLSHNFDVVEVLIKNIIETLKPMHLLVCTEGEVHPLTAHAIYHRNWQDYSADLLKIATLHERGGLYFCDVTQEHPAFVAPRAVSLDYGYLRRRSDNESDLIERVQQLAESILKAPDRIGTISREQTNACFSSLVDTEVEALCDSFYLSVSDPPFAYLEEPYLRLFDAMYGKEYQHPS